MRFGPPEGVKNCDYNKNVQRKNVPFELSIQIMLIADKKNVQKHLNFFVNNPGYERFQDLSLRNKDVG